MNDLRTAAQQALEAMLNFPDDISNTMFESIAALKAALAQQAEPVLVAERERERIASQWDGCVTHQLDAFGPVNIGASIRAGELVEAQQAEPVQPGAWDVTKDGRLIYDYDFTHDVVLRVMGDFEDDEQRVRYAKQIVDKLNAALVAAAEREACAKVCDEVDDGREDLSAKCAKAIRARGNT